MQKTAAKLQTKGPQHFGLNQILNGIVALAIAAHPLDVNRIALAVRAVIQGNEGLQPLYLVDVLGDRQQVLLFTKKNVDRAGTIDFFGWAFRNCRGAILMEVARSGFQRLTVLRCGNGQNDPTGTLVFTTDLGYSAEYPANLQ